MTQALDRALAEVAKLPPEEQDRVAKWLLAELSSERDWNQSFARSQHALGQLADEALADAQAGKATDLDPRKL